MKTHTHTKTLWNILKAVIRGKCIGLSAYIKESTKAQINGLMRQLKNLQNLPATPLTMYLYDHMMSYDLKLYLGSPRSRILQLSCSHLSYFVAYDHRCH